MTYVTEITNLTELLIYLKCLIRYFYLYIHDKIRMIILNHETLKIVRFKLKEE